MTTTADSGTSSSSVQHDPANDDSASNMTAQSGTGDGEQCVPLDPAKAQEAGSERAQLRAEVQALRAALADATLQRDQMASSLTLAHTVIEHMSDAAFWAQADGRLIYVNAAACQELGYNRNELLALSVVDVITDFDATHWATHWGNLRQAGTLRFDGWHRRKDGSVFPVEVSTNLIQAGSTVYACGIARNMSVRVEAERALADSEAKFAAAFGLSPIAMTLTEVKTGTFIDVNDAFLAATGYSRSEVIGRSSLELNLYSDPSDRVALLADVARFGQIADRAMQVRTKPGELRDCLISGRTLTVGDRSLLLASIMDITEQREVERALRASEQRFRSVTENAPDIIYVLDLAARQLIYLNRNELLGYTRAELQASSSILYAVHPDDLAAVRAQWLAPLSPGKSDSIEYRLRNKAGDWEWVHQRSRLIEGEPGQPPSLLVVTLSIVTERRHAESRLRESEERFRLAFENANDGVCLVGMDGGLLRVNARMADMFGYNAAEMETMSVQDLTHPDSIEASPTFINQAVAGESAHGVFDKKYIHRDGRELWGRVSSSLVRDAAGAPLYFISHVQDITEWRRAVTELADREARLHAIYDFAGVAIAVTEMDGCILDCNPHWREMLGYSQADLQGLSTGRITHPDDVAESQRHMEDLVAGRIASYRIEKRYLRADGQVLWADLSVSPLRDAQGVPVALVGAWTNITARKQAEAALHESEERYRLVMQGSGAGIWDWDLLRRRVYFSPQWKRMRGYDGDEIGDGDREWSERIHPDDRANVDATLDAYLAEAAQTPGNPPRFSLDYRSRHKDGSWLWIHDEGIVQLAADGTPVRMVGSEIDITQRKRAEEALRHSEGRLRAIFEASQAGILVSSLGGVIEFANQAAADLFGTSLDKVIGSAYLTHVHPSEQETAGQFIHRLAAGDLDALVTERHFQRADGREFWGLLSTRPLLDEAGNPSALLGIITDITEYKRVVASLRAAADDLRKAQSVARLGSWTWHIADDRLEWSDEMYTIFGIDKGSFTGNLADVIEAAIHPDDHAAVEAANRVGIETGRPEPLEYRVCWSDGSVRTVWSEAGELVRDGGQRPVRLTGIVQDITERKEAEQERERLLLQLQQAQKMETIGRLAGGIAHDFNNLLAVILMRLEMGLAMTEADAPIRRHLSESLHAAQRSADLTRQLLGFARRQPVTPRVLDFNASVADLLDMLRQLIGEEIRLTWQPGTDLWPVKLDPAQLSQILANLCVNARDAIDGAGTILIATQNVLLDVATAEASGETTAAAHVLLTVSDDGSGIDKAILDRLFEPFMTTKGVGKGTGLGLATVYGIVQQNGGDIRVYSEPGIGTTFRIYLPRHAGAFEPAMDDAPGEAPQGAGETILLVEDERAVMEMANELLDQLGYVVLAAATPGEALKVANSYPGPIDLVVTDVIMPEMNGRELAEQIQARRPAIRILYISGYPADLIAHRGVLSGDANLLAKPFARHALARRVRETLAQAPPDASHR